MTFAPDPRLAAASRRVADLELSEVRLQDDARFPWLVLIPRRPDLVELDDLSAPDRALLIEEIARAGRAVRALGLARGRAVDKLNVGALGNVVRQLHVHVLGRFADDPLQPGPVWGRGEAEPYAPDDLEAAVAVCARALAADGG